MPYSSPTALRNTNDYAKAVSPAPPGAIDLTALDEITVSREDSTLVITKPAGNNTQNDGDGFTHSVKRLRPGEKIVGDGAVFEALAFSVSPLPGPATNAQRNVPVDFFDFKGKPLSKDELLAMGFNKWQLTEYVSDYSYYGDLFPELKVWFGSKTQPPGYFTPKGLFDARTKQRLVSGYSYSQVGTNSIGYAELRSRAWHATPMELLVDVQLDGQSVVETNIAEDMTVPVAGGAVRLLGVFDGDVRSWSTRSGSTPGVETLRMQLHERENETNAVALFLAEPPGLAVQLELLDAQGKELPGAGGGSSGSQRNVGVRARADDVKRVRLTVFTNHHLVLMNLPPMPNLPAAAGSNLFEVTIPLVKVDREYQLRELIGDLTQLKFQYPSGGDQLPTNLFPLTLTNVTPAELVVFYRKNMTNMSTVIVDEKKQEIRVEPTEFEKAKRWLKQKLRF